MLLRCGRCNLVVDLPDDAPAVHRVCSQCRGPLTNKSPPKPHDPTVSTTDKMPIIKPPDDKP